MKIKTTKLRQQAFFKPETVNEENRTVELTWTTGAKVLRYGFLQNYFEELAMNKENIRMQRMENGAPLLNNHRSYGLENQIGVVEKAWLDGNEGRAVVRFSNRQDVTSIYQDVKDGIIRNVSVGYQVYKYQDVSSENDKTKTYRAVDWEPMEISLVTIAADSNAQVRNEETQEFETEIETVHGEQNKINERTQPMPQAQPIQGEDLKAQGIEQEKIRCTEIQKSVRNAGLDADLAIELISSGVSVEQAREQIILKMKERQAPPVTTPHVEFKDKDMKSEIRSAISDAIEHKVGQKVELNDLSRKFRNLTLIDMAREVLKSEGVRNVDHMSKQEIVQRSMNTTSDYPNILSNLVNKRLRMAYEEMPKTFEPLVKVVEVPDFKMVNSLQISEAPDLALVNENGAITRGAFTEGKESYQLATYAKIISISRQTLINDDLRVFSDLPKKMGAAAARLEADLVWNQITSNPTMADALTLFHATHANLPTSSATLDNTSLGAMVAAIRKQTGLASKKLNLQPGYLIVPPEREFAARSLVAPIYATQASQANIFAGILKGVIVEPRLAAAPFYLCGLIEQIDMIELAYLQGQKGLYTEQQNGFETDGVSIKVRLDVAAKVTEFRGLVKNNGV